MKYRPEIDGLRALAVVPVIFFHAGFDLFRGGYVGVDVFFVISGYLITTIILNEIQAGKFSIVNFYERRARRILPALAFILLCFLPFAYFWLLPKQLEEFSQSLMAVFLFVSNILFWQRTGYFDIATDLKPLLHTWSLAVEEQYYLFFPMLLVFIWRFGKRTMIWILVAIGLSSILLAQWATLNYPSASFFLMPMRLWEILIGSFAAFYFNFHKNEMKPRMLFFNQILGVLGLLLIAYAVFFFDEQTPFPSFYTLVPTIGTVLIVLFASENNLVGKFLGNKLFVGIGLISYSAYLWHQPIFAFARLVSVKAPSNQLMNTLAALSIVLAYLTWKFIETPFRDRAKFNRRKIFHFAVLSSAFFICIGFVGYLNKGFGSRVASNGMSFAELDQLITRANTGLGSICSYNSFVPVDQCETSDIPEIMVWGDSYAMHLVPGILASNPDAKIIQVTQNGCGPFVGLAWTNSRWPRTWAENCIQFNNETVEWLKNNSNVRYVVLGAMFVQYYVYDMFVDGEIIPSDKTLLLAHFEETLAMLSEMGIKPVVFAPPPSNGKDNIGDCLVKDAIYIGAIDCRIEMEAVTKNQKLILELLDEIEKNYQVIRVSDVLCSETFCEPELEGVPIYRDAGHLSVAGSEYLGKRMDFYKLITSKR